MRASGILLHISSLPSPHGIGTMGAAAKDFVDFLVKAGQAYWQILPVCPTSYGDSPYQSFSTFAGNPYFIDLDLLAKAGLVRDRNVTAYPAQDVYRELNEAGAHIVKDENVVLDGNMLTANGPGAAMLFGYSIGEYLGEDLQVAQLKEQMCYTGL